jgi:hypothetical protein
MMGWVGVHAASGAAVDNCGVKSRENGPMSRKHQLPSSVIIPLMF